MSSLISSLFSGRQTPDRNDETQSTPKKREGSPASGMLPLRQLLSGASPSPSKEKTPKPSGDAVFNDLPREPLADTAPLSDMPEAPVSVVDPPSDRTGTQTEPVNKKPTSSSQSRKEDDEDPEFSFRRFIGHRWTDDDTLEVQVEWEVGQPTWEPEANLHRDAQHALLSYWKKQGGRPPHPTDPDLYDIFAILDHSKDKKKLLVQWVGFSRKEATWEPTKVVEETAGDVVKEYWAGLPGKG